MGTASSRTARARSPQHVRGLRSNPTAWLIEPGPGKRGGAGRSSLAGAQEKFALVERDSEWHVPVGDSASTHILKPDLNAAFAGLPEVEHVTMRAAQRLGLDVAPTRLLEFDGIRTIVVERFDRTADGRRLHAEDCCQARGVDPASKHQADGGPGVSELADTIDVGVIRRADKLADRAQLWRHLAFSALVGATDAHAKNFSLLLGRGGARLAPGYDMSSFLPYVDAKDRSLRMAMKLGGEYAFYAVTEANVRRAAESLGLDDEWALGEWRRIRASLPQAIAAAVDELRATGLEPERTADFADRIEAWQAAPSASIGAAISMPSTGAPARARVQGARRTQRSSSGRFRAGD